jgi:hypothetical protein
MADINIKVDADVSTDARWILNRQERMERQRLDFIGDLFKYTANLVLTYDETEDGDENEDD